MDKLAQLLAQFEEKKAVNDAILKKEAVTFEDLEKSKAILAEMDDIKSQMTHEKGLQDARSRSEEHNRFLNDPAPSQMVKTLLGGGGGTFGNGVTFHGFTQDGIAHFEHTRKRLDMEYVTDRSFGEKAFKACREDGYKKSWDRMIRTGWAGLTNEEQKTLQEGIDTQGGYLAPEELLNRVIERKPTPTRLAAMVSRLTIGRDSVSIPKVNYTTDDIYTTGMRVTWGSETPAATSHRVTEPIFGKLTIPVFTALMSIPVTMDMIEDGMIDLMAWLSGKFGETIELVRDDMILNGSGVGQPMGILANPGGTNQPATVVTGAAAELTGDGLIDLTEALPEQYDENAVLVFNKTNTGKAIRKLKDGDGRPLVSYGAADNGLAGGRYKEVNGYDYKWSGFAPNVAANAYPIVFGDLSGYVQVDRVGLSVQVLNEAYAEQNMKLLLGRVRFGGMTAEEWRLRVQKVAAS